MNWKISLTTRRQTNRSIVHPNAMRRMQNLVLCRSSTRNTIDMLFSSLAHHLRRWLLLVFLSSAVLGAFAQIKGAVIYEFRHADNHGLSANPQYIVRFSGGVSAESVHRPGTLRATETFDPTTNESTVNNIFKAEKPYFLRKDVDSNQLLLSSQVSLRRFLTQDSLHPFDWQIDYNTATDTLGYTCYRATTHFRGRDYIAWFAPDIPIPHGPWKFGGLPGLIFRVYSTDRHFEYSVLAIDFQADFADDSLGVPAEYADDDAITHQDYIVLDDRWRERLSKRNGIEEAGVLADGRTTRSTSTVLIPARRELF